MTMTCGLPMSSYLTFKGDLLQQKQAQWHFHGPSLLKLCVLASWKRRASFTVWWLYYLRLSLYSNCFQSIFYSPCYKRKKNTTKMKPCSTRLFCIDWHDTNLNSEYNKSETKSFVLICLCCLKCWNVLHQLWANLLSKSYIWIKIRQWNHKETI